MAFTFTPLSDEEIQAVKNRSLMPNGVYPFVVKSAEHAISQSNNPMIKVTLAVMDKEGNERLIPDWLLATDTSIEKLKHFCDSIGLVETYARGSFEPHEFLNRSGRCLVGIQKGKTKDDGSIFPDKNSIKDYIKRDVRSPLPEKSELNDDIGF
jgi:hypothetical protein